MSKNLELPNHVESVLVQLRQSWDNGLDFPPTKIPERYTRFRGTVGLEVVCELGGVKFRVFPLITFDDGTHLKGEISGSGSDAEDEFFVLIRNVKIVDNSERIVHRVGGAIRLKAFNQADDLGVCDFLYFSLKSGDVVFLDWLFRENRKLNRHVVLCGPGGEVPNNMVEAGAQMVNDLTSKHSES